eukprot:TRINITY_DN2796_c0_g1_i3.p1 TRINITY_DN2796_c0_g1~~TRINITY_DN2796_c0_g1_i3.p1  ORF type:complete len:145 (-),score=31.59 TRINITY_DN2796_c0_g1_i3:57-491(-)
MIFEKKNEEDYQQVSQEKKELYRVRPFGPYENNALAMQVIKMHQWFRKLPEVPYYIELPDKKQHPAMLFEEHARMIFLIGFMILGGYAHHQSNRIAFPGGIAIRYSIPFSLKHYLKTRVPGLLCLGYIFWYGRFRPLKLSLIHI